jgi:hypothetical protein
MRVQAAFEVHNGLIRTETLRKRPDLLVEVQEFLLADIREALWGLGPIVGRERLLEWCASIIAEDFDHDDPRRPRAMTAPRTSIAHRARPPPQKVEARRGDRRASRFFHI